MPFLHITTRIEGKKHDDLLIELEFGSFPSLGFLDAEGEVVARQFPPYTVGLFKDTKGKIERWRGLVEKAAAGDRTARTDALILSCELGRIDYGELEEELEGLELNEAQKKRVKSLYADDDLDALQQVWRRSRDPEFRQNVVDDLVTMTREGEHPSRSDLKLWFWRQVAEAGWKARDASLLAPAIEALKPLEPHYAPLQGYLGELEERLAGLRSGAAK